jgi:hypothetical protein
MIHRRIRRLPFTGWAVLFSLVTAATYAQAAPPTEERGDGGRESASPGAVSRHGSGAEPDENLPASSWQLPLVA